MKLLYKCIDFFSASKSKYRNHLVPFPTQPDRASPQAVGGAIVAFYTKNSLYEFEAKRMVSSARRLGLSVETTAFDSAGSWVRNASLKAAFLLEARKQQRGPLLYVDVDAVFHRNPWPQLSHYECDIALYRENGRLLSGTILLNDTPQTLRLLEEWKKRSDANPDIWDQVVLQEILDQDRALETGFYSVEGLPATFCWIFDRLSNVRDDHVFIEHLQASRQAKGAEKRGRNKSLERRAARIEAIEKILAVEEAG
ncbi:putative nucleotide-diphospho-sugar transferase [Rhizobium sp. S163]|uniref:putative nucleotide-diphospho-sugar transferase n=1 Tax=Rhizobium sp. S163 TaxID=3055039 RepID=UPI0025A9E052|nr:putative nucleotide-diphospho-sugar transferase [Rhizobium sp. S163]MDM9646811.1 putative nucleotide-diphospho-sugar transferase [Rhizobium sp. S163]